MSLSIFFASSSTLLHVEIALQLAEPSTHGSVGCCLIIGLSGSPEHRQPRHQADHRLLRRCDAARSRA